LKQNRNGLPISYESKHGLRLKSVNRVRAKPNGLFTPLKENSKTKIELHLKFEAQFLLYKEHEFSLYFQGLSRNSSTAVLLYSDA